MKVFNASDLGKVRGRRGEGVDLDHFPAPSAHPGAFIILEGRESWEMAGHALAYAGHRPCPVCNGAALGRKRYCLGCDRTGLDGRVEFPGLDVNAARDPDWRPEPTSYEPDPTLAGGTEPKRAKLRRGISRARRQGIEAKPDDVARLSPLGHENINFLGRYSFALSESVARGELRPLHNPDEAASQAGPTAA